jgi:hypothetical protein
MAKDRDWTGGEFASLLLDVIDYIADANSVQMEIDKVVKLTKAALTAHELELIEGDYDPDDDTMMTFNALEEYMEEHDLLDEDDDDDEEEEPEVEEEEFEDEEDDGKV